MRAARRQHRASPQSRNATFDRGMQQAYAALYSTEPVTPERAAALQRDLSAPRATRQGDLLLEVPK